jgi:hypothetical protein
MSAAHFDGVLADRNSYSSSRYRLGYWELMDAGQGVFPEDYDHEVGWYCTECYVVFVGLLWGWNWIFTYESIPRFEGSCVKHRSGSGEI